MFSRKARRIPWKKSLLLTVLAFAIVGSASVALASQEAWTVIFGTAGNDTINETGQPGNFRIYGFLGKDTLTGGIGDSVLVGDGHCPPGTANQSQITVVLVLPPAGDPANNADQYCDEDPIAGDGGDKLKGGIGSSAIIGGGGSNRLTGGQSSNYIQDGPSTDLIYGGPSGDVINATNGPSTIYPGTGTNYIDTRGPGVSRVYCTGQNDYVYANTNDQIHACAHVYYTFLATNHAVVSTAKHKNHKKHHETRKKSKKHFVF